AAAVTDLLKNNQFTLLSGRAGPFDLHLAIEENRLLMEIRAAADGASESIVLPLAPFRRIVKDYFLVCESYYEAIRDKSLSQVEAIDVGGGSNCCGRSAWCPITSSRRISTRRRVPVNCRPAMRCGSPKPRRASCNRATPALSSSRPTRSWPAAGASCRRPRTRLRPEPA